MKKLFFLILSAFLLNTTMNAQSYIGYTLDNYSGIHGVTIKPANIVDSPFKADIIIVSASAFGGSD